MYYEYFTTNKETTSGQCDKCSGVKTEEEITWSRCLMEAGQAEDTEVKVCRRRELVRAECRPLGEDPNGLRNGVKW